MMGTREGRRVPTKEAAAILGIDEHLMSRLDAEGRWIKRYKLTRKTHVYDVESLYNYLESCQSKPLQKPVVSASAGRSTASFQGSVSAKPKFSLREFLPQKRIA